MLNVQNITENNIREFNSQELFDLSWDLSENKSAEIKKISEIINAELERRVIKWENN
jgi:hypothetical protein